MRSLSLPLSSHICIIYLRTPLTSVFKSSLTFAVMVKDLAPERVKEMTNGQNKSGCFGGSLMPTLPVNQQLHVAHDRSHDAKMPILRSGSQAHLNPIQSLKPTHLRLSRWSMLVRRLVPSETWHTTVSTEGHLNRFSGLFQVSFRTCTKFPGTGEDISPMF